MARIIIYRKSTLVSQLISPSTLPVFYLGVLLFISILVSFPVNITIPSIWPAEATTVLAQAVFSFEMAYGVLLESPKYFPL